MEKLRICSLFSGLGGFEEGIYQAIGKDRADVVFSSEIDKFASSSYTVMHGHQPNGDITQVDARDIPDHDLLVAGFPCQAFSLAGKRKGFDDTRGTLFFEVARILKEKRPAHFILENVKGLLSHNKGETFDVIIETLRELDYTFHYQVLNSKFFDVPQNRERIFIVGSTDKDFRYDFPANETVTKAIKDVLEHSVDEKFYLKPEQVAKFQPKQNKEIICLNPRKDDGTQTYQQDRIYHHEGITPALCSTLSNLRISVEGTLEGLKTIEQNKRVFNTEGIAPTIDTMTGGNRQPKIMVEGTIGAGHTIGDKQPFRIRKLTPKECLRIQGFPDTYHDTLKEAGVSNSQLYKMAGNAVSPPVIAALVRNLFL